jgi:hypothetical protein
MIKRFIAFQIEYFEDHNDIILNGEEVILMERLLKHSGEAFLEWLKEGGHRLAE